MGIIDEVKNYLEYRKRQSVSPSAPERVDYYESIEDLSSHLRAQLASERQRETVSESLSPSPEATPSLAPSYSPNHTMMSHTTSSLGIIDPVFNTETERLPRPVKVKKSPVVKISSERQNRKLDNDK